MKLLPKKILKIGILVLIISVVLYFTNELFIRDLRIQYSEYRVKKSMQENFKENKQDFLELQDLLNQLRPNITTILEFKDPDTLNCIIKSPSGKDSKLYNTIPYSFSSSELNEGEVNFQLQKNGLIIITKPDTTIKTFNWYLNFNGNKEDIIFKDLIDYIGIKEEQLDSIRTLLEKLDCEDLTIFNHNSFSLRYEGISLYQYEYLYTDTLSEYQTEYQLLSNGIYFGLMDSGIFCGTIIFKK